jgi:hypothetical protein
MASTIAKAVDPTRSRAETARIISPARAGILPIRAGNTLPLTGLPGHPLLDVGSSVLTMATRQPATSGRYGSPDTARDAVNAHVRITVLGRPSSTYRLGRWRPSGRSASAGTYPARSTGLIPRDTLVGGLPDGASPAETGS